MGAVNRQTGRTYDTHCLTYTNIFLLFCGASYIAGMYVSEQETQTLVRALAEIDDMIDAAELCRDIPSLEVDIRAYADRPKGVKLYARHSRNDYNPTPGLGEKHVSRLVAFNILRSCRRLLADFAQIYTIRVSISHPGLERGYVVSRFRYDASTTDAFAAADDADGSHFRQVQKL